MHQIPSITSQISMKKYCLGTCVNIVFVRLRLLTVTYITLMLMDTSNAAPSHKSLRISCSWFYVSFFIASGGLVVMKIVSTICL